MILLKKGEARVTGGGRADGQTSESRGCSQSSLSVERGTAAVVEGEGGEGRMEKDAGR